MQARQPGAVLAALAPAQGAGRGHLDDLAALGRGGGLLEGLEEVDDRLGRQVLVVVVVDLDHGGVDAGAQALDLDEGEEVVLGRVAGGDAQVVGDGLDDLVAAAAAELTGGLFCRSKSMY